MPSPTAPSGYRKRNWPGPAWGRGWTGCSSRRPWGAEKPSLDFFQPVLQAIGPWAREEILLIGDSLTSDMAGGNRAGIPCRWYNPQGQPLPGTWISGMTFETSTRCGRLWRGTGKLPYVDQPGKRVALSRLLCLRFCYGKGKVWSPICTAVTWAGSRISANWT